MCCSKCLEFHFYQPVRLYRVAVLTAVCRPDGCRIRHLPFLLLPLLFPVPTFDIQVLVIPRIAVPTFCRFTIFTRNFVPGELHLGTPSFAWGAPALPGPGSWPPAWERQCSAVSCRCTLRNVLADFAVCRALCDVKFHQIEANSRQFRHIELSNSVIS